MRGGFRCAVSAHLILQLSRVAAMLVPSIVVAREAPFTIYFSLRKTNTLEIVEVSEPREDVWRKLIRTIKKLELDPRNDPESSSKSPYPSSMTLCRILCLKETPDFLVERPPWPQLPAPSSRYILRQDSGNTEVCSYDILMSYAIIYHNTDPPHNFPSESPTKCHK